MVRTGLGVALTALAVDQATKAYMLYGVFEFDFPATSGQWHPPIEITANLNLVTVWNTGVSFGMFAAGSETVKWILVGLALTITTILLVWLWRSSSRLVSVALGLIVGGAIGNVIDRLVYGAVADFVDVHLWGYHWPAFNVADSTIMIGVGLLLFDSLFSRTAEKPTSAEGGTQHKDAGE